MLRIPNQLEQESELQETEIDDKSYQINVINSHWLLHRQCLGDLGTQEEMPKSEMLQLGEYQERMRKGTKKKVKTAKEASLPF